MRLIHAPVSPGLQFDPTGGAHGEATEIIHQAQDNRARIIESSLALEKRLNTLLAHYFFPGTVDRREIFTSLVLNSDWCSFASKRKLLKQLLNQHDWLPGQEKNDFDRLLRDVMSYRNAFTHGTLSTSGGTVLLSFFEGGPQEKELSDAFLGEIERKLRMAHDGIAALSLKVSAPPVP
jgi:hypothetical protein